VYQELGPAEPRAARLQCFMNGTALCQPISQNIATGRRNGFGGRLEWLVQCCADVIDLDASRRKLQCSLDCSPTGVL
jgi:hypothetical protein